jgi:hypothetical protein
LPLDINLGGTYVWDVTTLAPAAYFVYGVIYDSAGDGKAYAPGAVVIAPAAPAGYLVEEDADIVKKTTGTGGTAKIRMKLGRAPVSSVSVPLSSSKPNEGTVQPAQLTFAPANWDVWQAATVTGVNDCVPGDKVTPYQINVGNAQSLDPDYMGITGVPYQMVNQLGQEARSTTDNPNLHICGLQIASELQVDKQNWEYQLRADLSNIGLAVPGVIATLIATPDKPDKFTIVQPVMRFGAVNRSEIGRTSGSVTVRTKTKINQSMLNAAKGFRWTMTVTP